MNERMALKHGVDFGGPDCSANLRRMKELKGNVPHPEAEAEGAALRAAVEARANAARPQTFEERVAELEQRVNALEQ